MIAPEPILPPCLLCQKVPLLVELSDYFVSLCNFSVMYFIPLWFQTVPLDSASIAGLHLLPDSMPFSVSTITCSWLIAWASTR
ncbi:hypothetical protein V8E55_008316 [Tylopilus felleus]